MTFVQKMQLRKGDFNMAYNGFLPENVIRIGKIYSIHYFEYMSDFSFEGESHDFWEFICVDKG